VGREKVVLKSPAEIAIMREAGRIAALALREAAAAAEPGVSTAELDAIAEEGIRSRGGIPSFKGLYGFPASICSSINDEIVHGIPSPKRILRDGDIVKIDIGALYRGFHSDTAMTVPVGDVSPEIRCLLEVTEQSLWAGIRAAQSGGKIRDIAWAIERSIQSKGDYGIVRRYVGHGIGRSFHEPPQIPNWVDPEHPPVGILRTGLVIAIEPMVNLGTWDTRQNRGDDWTVLTADGKRSAHFEHTVAITDGDPEVLTLP
jgi:methionyl aminopeptidase